MATIQLHRLHSLGLDGARAAANDVAARLRDDFGVTTEWHGDVLHVGGHGIDGRLTVTDGAVDVHARLGLLARPFRRRLHDEIEEELDRTLATPPATPLP